MKKHFHNSLRALFLSLAVLMSLPMLAVEVEIDGINYELVSKLKLATVIAKSSGKYSGKVVIPESVEHEGTAYSVTSIGKEAFSYCSGLTSVHIGNGVTSIGDRAFLFCSGLTSVTIPNSVTSIGGDAFYNCSGLTSVTISNSVTSIGGSAFAYCSGLTSVTIGNSVTSIGFNAFYECYGLTSVHISDIAAWCNIDFTNGPSNPLSYAHHLYLNGEEVKDLVIPNSVTSIGNYAFRNCYGFTSVTIPNSVKSIGSEAFRDCSELLDVYCYAEKVPSTDSDAFYDSYIENATLHVPAASLDSYRATAPWSRFGKIVAISTEVDGIRYELLFSAKQATVIAKSSGKYSGEVVIPESVEHEGAAYSVTSIGNRAFYYCSGLTSVHIGNGVTSIRNRAFEGCSGLTSVHISDIAAWCNIDFASFDSNPLSYAHHLYLNGEEVKNLVIPNSVTSIDHSAFEGCSGLTSVTIPNSVTSIGYDAFKGCSGLTSVTIGNGVTSIGYDAFEGCSGLTSVTIGNSVTSIGDGAFRNCPELLDVYCYAEKVPYAVSNAFDGSYPEYATLHVPDASIDSYKATAPWSSFGKIVALTPEETGIDELKGENGKVKTALYDLSGRRVQKGQMGIFIQNGKVMVK